MKSKHAALIAIALAILVFAMIAACNTSEDSQTTIRIELIDAPIDDADEVNLTVTAISIKGDEWIDLEVAPQRFDLLELQNGAEAVLADQEIQQGEYSELRLVIQCTGTSAPDIVVEGESHDLIVPSGCTSGFKIKGDFTIVESVETVLVLDFDVRKSVHEIGNGAYMLNPVVRLVRADTAGDIKGEIDPAVSRAVVYAFEPDTFESDNFDDAVNSTIAYGNGTFTLAALPEGTYDIVVQAAEYQTKVYLQDVQVTPEEKTILDTPIELEEL